MGQKNFVRFREVSALERFCLFWTETRKNPTQKTADLLDIPTIPFTFPPIAKEISLKTIRPEEINFY